MKTETGKRYKTVTKESGCLRAWGEPQQEQDTAKHSPLRCTKSKVPYTEALAQERDKLRAQLNSTKAELEQVTAERDSLRKSFKEMEREAWQAKALARDALGALKLARRKFCP